LPVPVQDFILHIWWPRRW